MKKYKYINHSTGEEYATGAEADHDCYWMGQTIDVYRWDALDNIWLIFMVLTQKDLKALEVKRED